MYVCVCTGFVYMSAGNVTDQQRESDLLELDLQTVVSCPRWALGTELGPLEELMTSDLPLQPS